MSMQDPISDCLNIIRNGLMRHKDVVLFPYSKLKHDLVNVLVDEGYLLSAEKVSVDSKNFVSVGLKYFDGQPVIKNLERISRPGLRKYEGVKDLTEVNAGLGIYILTTNQGLMTDKTARSQNIGGEVLVRIF